MIARGLALLLTLALLGWDPPSAGGTGSAGGTLASLGWEDPPSAGGTGSAGRTLALLGWDRDQQTAATISLRQYLAPAVAFSEADAAAAERGRPVGKILSSRSNAEIFVVGAIFIAASPDAYIARATDPGKLMVLPGYRATGLIGDPPDASMFGGFTLEPEDITDLKSCAPSDCAVQLPAAVIGGLRAAARNPNLATASAQANDGMRRMAADLVRSYRERGNAALPIYNDESRAANVAEQFQSLMQRFETLAVAPPEVSRLMRDYPNAVPNVPDLRSVFYWERVVFGLKPTIRVTHAMAYRPATGPLGCIVAIKQIYASHYLRAAIDFSSCLVARGRDGREGFYLVAVKGSRQEGLTGLTGSLIRRIVVSRTRTALEGSLIRIKNAIEGR